MATTKKQKKFFEPTMPRPKTAIQPKKTELTKPAGETVRPPEPPDKQTIFGSVFGNGTHLVFLQP